MEGLDERLLGLVVLAGRLLGLVIGAGLQHLVPQDGRQLDGWRDREEEKREVKSETKGGDSENEKLIKNSPQYGLWAFTQAATSSKQTILVPPLIRAK